MNKKVEIALIICAIFSVYSFFYKFLGLFPSLTFFYSNTAGIFSFLIGLLLLCISFIYVNEGYFKNVYSVIKIFLLALTFTSLIDVPVNILLYEYLDPNHKERVADYKLEQMLQDLEDYGGKEKVSFSFDKDKFRKDILNNYSQKAFLINPLKAIFLNVILSLVFGAIISKFGTEEDKIDYSNYRSPAN